MAPGEGRDEGGRGDGEEGDPLLARAGVRQGTERRGEGGGEARRALAAVARVREKRGREERVALSSLSHVCSYYFTLHAGVCTNWQTRFLHLALMGMG